MFGIFRRRGRAAKSENQANVVQTDSSTKVELKYDLPAVSIPHETLEHGARASDLKVNLDTAAQQSKEKRPINFDNYHQHGDGVVVSADSRNESADPLRRSSGGKIDRDENVTKDSGADSFDEKPSKRTNKNKYLSLNRSSIFFRAFNTTPSGSNYSTIPITGRCSSKDFVKVPIEKSASVTPVPETTVKKSTRFNPIQRGRDLFNDIVMAKGRNRNQRNHRRKKAHTIADSPRIIQTESQYNDPANDPTSSSVCHGASTDDSASADSNQISSTSKNMRHPQTTECAISTAPEKVEKVKASKCANATPKFTRNEKGFHPLSARIFNIENYESTTSESSSDEQAVSEEYLSSITHGESVTAEQQSRSEEDQGEAENGTNRLNVDDSETYLESECHTATVNVEQFGHIDADKLAELTECDQDHFRNNHNEDMGQSQAKIEPSTSAAAVTISRSHLDEQKATPTADTERVVPKIIVEDFGNVDENVTDEKSDVFYDVEVPKNEEKFLKVPEEGNDDDADDDEDDEPWHFVSALQQNVNQSELDTAGITINYPKATENFSDSNLSNSDSGVITTDQQIKVLHLDSCDLINESGTDPTPQQYRDVSATDSNQNLPHRNDFDYYRDLPTVVDNIEVIDDDHDNKTAILIESISLPDVVVESTVVKNSSSDSVNSDHHIAVNSGGNNDSDNVDSSGCVKMGNAHFIPIRVEKRRSVDDSVLMSKSANGGNTLYNGQQYNEGRSTLEITPEEDEQVDDGNAADERVTADLPEAEQPKTDRNIAGEVQVETSGSQEEQKKKDLVDQESGYNTQLSDAQKNVYNLQSKVNELQAKIDELEKDLSVKSWNVERLQGELGAAAREDECVRSKLRLLEEEKTKLRQKFSDTEEELKNKYGDLEQKYKELEEKYKQIQSLAANLQTQLACAQSEAEQCRLQSESLQQAKDDQIRELEESLAKAKQEQVALQTKWQTEFETLRTQNADREEHLMTDCEWQLRQMQKTCKEKLEKAENQRKEAMEKIEQIEKEAEDKLLEVAHLKSVEAEVRQLRGLTTDQENSIKSMRDQIETLKADLVTANENLEEQLENVRKIKFQCDNALYDKEREMLQRIDEVRHEAAVRWENKLITEMTRLKMELESVYVDERREELDRLQAEHIEELKALTTRYTANEEELRAEIAELQESLNQRTQEFMDLREKSDNAILTTRMHLDRADREYQNAMCREEDRREQLIENLRKEFEVEKLDMEEKFRERLGQVQAEFNKELQISTQELSDNHQKEMDQQRQKLIREKETAIQELESRQRKRLEDAETRLHDAEIRHQHDLSDLKIMYDTEKVALDKRDISNAQEIEQLHRKCRCLTNLFEEMRMRYERRDPRPEDLREIAELRSRCESQERDLFELTDRLREMQIQMEELQGINNKKSQIRKPLPKTIPTNCDVIYEENEERESPPPPSNSLKTPQKGHFAKETSENKKAEDDEEENSESTAYSENTINDDDRDNDTSLIDSEKKSLNLLNDSNQSMNNFNQIIEAE